MPDPSPPAHGEAQKNFEAALAAAPFAMFQGPEKGYKSIPAAMDAVIVDDHAWQELACDAVHILAALEKLAPRLKNSSEGRQLLVGLAPLEREESAYGGLATVRLDLFFEGDALFVIEVNATIPAMQAYSDMIKEAYAHAFFPGATLPLSSNGDALLEALLAHYARCGGTQPRPRIAIVAREHDSQMAELLWLRKRWQAKAYSTVIVTPDELDIREGRLWTGTIAVDLCYRHIFAHRLPPASPFARACLESERFRVFNPIAAHLEAKGTLAELSRLAADEAESRLLGLSDAERQAILRRVVWSRVLKEGSVTGPKGELLADLVEWVIAHRDSVVIKSSFGYGGRGVFVGRFFGAERSAAQIRSFFPHAPSLDWASFVRLLARQGDGQWIVQKYLSGRSLVQSFIAEGKAQRQTNFIDCSLFASTGIGLAPSGGVCRFSSSAVVNLGLGGGLAPFFLASEWQALMAQNSVAVP